MRHATDIVGYIYKAEQYTPEGVIAALATGPGQDFDGWALAEGSDPLSPEENLDEIAAAFGIDRHDEHTYDSDHFPKVIFASQVEDDDELFVDEHNNHVRYTDI